MKNGIENVKNVELELTDEQLELVIGGSSLHPTHQQNNEDRRGEDEHRRRHWHPGHWGWNRQHHHQWTPGGWW